mgnify:CR=1 FL=1
MISFECDLRYNDIILLLSVLITVAIYCMRRGDVVKHAAISVKQQITEIEKNIEYLRKFGVASSGSCSVINEQEWFISTPIFSTNQFELYSAVLIKHLSHDEYELLSSFYKTASVILRLQTDVKQFSYLCMSSKANNFYMITCKKMEQNESTKDIVSEINKWNDVNKIINVPSYIPAQYGLYFDKYITEYHQLTGTVLFSKLDKLTHKKMSLL